MYASEVPNLFIQFYVYRAKQFYVIIVLKFSHSHGFLLLNFLKEVYLIFS